MGVNVELRDGSEISIRPIEVEDRDLLKEGFDRLSPETRYRRFFSPIDELSERQLDYLTRVDHHDHEALVAIAPDGSCVGVARFVRTRPEEAEPAVVVVDDWQGRGVASILLARLVERALDEGITHFNATVLAGNREPIAAVGRRGQATISRHGSEVEVRVALGAEPAPTPLQLLLRALAAGTVDPAWAFWQRLLPRRAASLGNHSQRANVVVTALHPEDGEVAVALTQRMASAAGSKVVVVAARHPLLDDRADVEQRARRAAARLRAHEVDARDVVRAGDLAAIVLDVAIEERARLIVIGDLPGADAPGRLLGEPWDHISRHAPCNVLVAR
jgi:GNAT superfamily N-acetyltransferase